MICDNQLSFPVELLGDVVCRYLPVKAAIVCYYTNYWHGNQSGYVTRSTISSDPCEDLVRSDQAGLGIWV